MPLLSILIFTPLVGALLVTMLRSDRCREIALTFSLIEFMLSLILWWYFDPQQGLQFIEKHVWISSFNTYYFLGIDGLSLFFIPLTTFLISLSILASWTSIQNRVREYMAAFLLLETFLVGLFCSLDLILFYIFFEGALIPMTLIIGVWGGERRIYACLKFFLFSLCGSILMLLALIMLYYQAGTTDFLQILKTSFPWAIQKWLWLAFFIAFAIKIPVWPFHTWLPDAHVEAPTAGSVILAGVLLKMGGYGLLRFSLPLFPLASYYFAPLVVLLCLVAVIYAALVALVQNDIKKVIAYSSIAHMGLVTLGIFTFNPNGLTGAVFQMLSHGIVSASLFLSAGMLHDRFHTYEISHYGGLVTHMPRYAGYLLLFSFAALGLPGTSGFIGEFLVILGVFRANALIAIIASLSLIIVAAYILWLYKRVVLETTNPKLGAKGLVDITLREGIILGSLAGIILVSGLFPQPFIKIIDPAVKTLLVSLPPSQGEILPFFHITKECNQ